MFCQWDPRVRVQGPVFCYFHPPLWALELYTENSRQLTSICAADWNSRQYSLFAVPLQQDIYLLSI